MGLCRLLGLHQLVTSQGDMLEYGLLTAEECVTAKQEVP
jgi:hypothetical protein